MKSELAVLWLASYASGTTTKYALESLCRVTTSFLRTVIGDVGTVAAPEGGAGTAGAAGAAEGSGVAGALWGLGNRRGVGRALCVCLGAARAVRWKRRLGARACCSVRGGIRDSAGRMGVGGGCLAGRDHRASEAGNEEEHARARRGRNRQTFSPWKWK